MNSPPSSSQEAPLPAEASAVLPPQPSGASTLHRRTAAAFCASPLSGLQRTLPQLGDEQRVPLPTASRSFDAEGSSSGVLRESLRLSQPLPRSQLSLFRSNSLGASPFSSWRLQRQQQTDTPGRESFDGGAPSRCPLVEDAAFPSKTSSPEAVVHSVASAKAAAAVALAASAALANGERPLMRHNVASFSSALPPTRQPPPSLQPECIFGDERPTAPSPASRSAATEAGGSLRFECVGNAAGAGGSRDDRASPGLAAAPSSVSAERGGETASAAAALPPFFSFAPPPPQVCLVGGRLLAMRSPWGLSTSAVLGRNGVSDLLRYFSVLQSLLLPLRWAEFVAFDGCAAAAAAEAPTAAAAAAAEGASVVLRLSHWREQQHALSAFLKRCLEPAAAGCAAVSPSAAAKAAPQSAGDCCTPGLVNSAASGVGATESLQGLLLFNRLYTLAVAALRRDPVQPSGSLVDKAAFAARIAAAEAAALGFSAETTCAFVLVAAAVAAVDATTAAVVSAAETLSVSVKDNAATGVSAAETPSVSVKDNAAAGVVSEAAFSVGQKGEGEQRLKDAAAEGGSHQQPHHLRLHLPAHQPLPPNQHLHGGSLCGPQFSRLVASPPTVLVFEVVPRVRCTGTMRGEKGEEAAGLGGANKSFAGEYGSAVAWQLLEFQICEVGAPPLQLLSNFCGSLRFWVQLDRQLNVAAISLHPKSGCGALLLLAAAAMSCGNEARPSASRILGQIREASLSAQTAGEGPPDSAAAAAGSSSAVSWLGSTRRGGGVLNWIDLDAWTPSCRRYLHYFQTLLRKPVGAAAKDSNASAGGVPASPLRLKNFVIENFAAPAALLVVEIYEVSLACCCCCGCCCMQSTSEASRRSILNDARTAGLRLRSLKTCGAEGATPGASGCTDTAEAQACQPSVAAPSQESEGVSQAQSKKGLVSFLKKQLIFSPKSARDWNGVEGAASVSAGEAGAVDGEVVGGLDSDMAFHSYVRALRRQRRLCPSSSALPTAAIPTLPEDVPLLLEKAGPLGHAGCCVSAYAVLPANPLCLNDTTGTRCCSAAAEEDSASAAKETAAQAACPCEFEEASSEGEGISPSAEPSSPEHRLLERLQKRQMRQHIRDSEREALQQQKHRRQIHPHFVLRGCAADYQLMAADDLPGGTASAVLDFSRDAEGREQSLVVSGDVLVAVRQLSSSASSSSSSSSSSQTQTTIPRRSQPHPPLQRRPQQAIYALYAFHTGFVEESQAVVELSPADLDLSGAVPAQLRLSLIFERVSAEETDWCRIEAPLSSTAASANAAAAATAAARGEQLGVGVLPEEIGKENGEGLCAGENAASSRASRPVAEGQESDAASSSWSVTSPPSPSPSPPPSPAAGRSGAGGSGGFLGGFVSALLNWQSAAQTPQAASSGRGKRDLQRRLTSTAAAASASASVRGDSSARPSPTASAFPTATPHEGSAGVSEALLLRAQQTTQPPRPSRREFVIRHVLWTNPRIAAFLSEATGCSTESCAVALKLCGGDMGLALSFVSYYFAPGVSTSGKGRGRPFSSDFLSFALPAPWQQLQQRMQRESDLFRRRQSEKLQRFRVSQQNAVRQQLLGRARSNSQGEIEESLSWQRAEAKAPFLRSQVSDEASAGVQLPSSAKREEGLLAAEEASEPRPWIGVLSDASLPAESASSPGVQKGSSEGGGQTLEKNSFFTPRECVPTQGGVGSLLHSVPPDLNLFSVSPLSPLCPPLATAVKGEDQAQPPSAAGSATPNTNCTLSFGGTGCAQTPELKGTCSFHFLKEGVSPSPDFASVRPLTKAALAAAAAVESQGSENSSFESRGASLAGGGAVCSSEATPLANEALLLGRRQSTASPETSSFAAQQGTERRTVDNPLSSERPQPNPPLQHRAFPVEESGALQSVPGEQCGVRTPTQTQPCLKLPVSSDAKGTVRVSCNSPIANAVLREEDTQRISRDEPSAETAQSSVGTSRSDPPGAQPSSPPSATDASSEAPSATPENPSKQPPPSKKEIPSKPPPVKKEIPSKPPPVKKGIPPKPPPVKKGIPPKPPPSAKGPGLPPKGPPPKKSILGTKEELPLGRKIHWKALTEDKIGGTVWSTLDVLQSSVVADHEALSRLFSKNATGKSPSPGATGAATAKSRAAECKTIVSSKRAQNVAIVLARLGVSTQDAARLLESLDSRGLTVDTLEKIEQILPTPEERPQFLQFLETQRMQRGRGGGDEDRQGEGAEEEGTAKLRDVEAAMLPFLKVSQLPLRLRALRLEMALPKTTQEIASTLSLFNKACQQARESRRFRVLLQAALQWGNYVNHGVKGNGEDAMQNEESHPPRPADAKTLLPTRGFTLSSLFQVIEFRSTVDTKISSLHFILAKLLASMPEVGLEKLPTEMEAVVAAAKASDEALDGAALYIAEEVVFLQTQIQKAKKGCKTEQQRGEGGEQNAAAEALSVEGESLAEPPLLGEKELDRLRHIHGEASFHWQELKERYSQTKEAVTALSRFFGEEPKRPSASALPSPFLLAQGWGGVVAASPFALLTNILKAVKNVLKDLQLHPRRYAVLLSSKGQPTPNNNEASHGPREGLEGLNKGLETSPPCSNPPPEIAETKAEHPAKMRRAASCAALPKSYSKTNGAEAQQTKTRVQTNSNSPQESADSTRPPPLVHSKAAASAPSVSPVSEKEFNGRQPINAAPPEASGTFGGAERRESFANSASSQPLRALQSSPVGGAASSWRFGREPSESESTKTERALRHSPVAAVPGAPRRVKGGSDVSLLQLRGEAFSAVDVASKIEKALFSAPAALVEEAAAAQRKKKEGFTNNNNNNAPPQKEGLGDFHPHNCPTPGGLSARRCQEGRLVDGRFFPPPIQRRVPPLSAPPSSPSVNNNPTTTDPNPNHHVARKPRQALRPRLPPPPLGSLDQSKP